MNNRRLLLFVMLIFIASCEKESKKDASNSLSAPDLSLPANNAVVDPNTIYFSWTNVAQASAYEIEIASDTNFTQIVQSSNTSNTNYYYLVNNTATQDQVFYWHVRALATGINPSNYSSSFSYILPGIVVNPPFLSLPGNATAVANNTPNFVWTSVAGASSYIIEIASDINFNTLVLNTTVSGSAYGISSSNPLPSGTYYWRVKADNTVYSEIFTLYVI